MLFAGAILGAAVNGMMGGCGALMAEAYQQLLVQRLKMYYLISGRAMGGFSPMVVSM